ncbi:MAG: ADP-glyceromanno-heptose 6-epimerase [Campylobacterales bacterium]
MKYTNFNFNGKTILITGGAGFIGSNLALYFQREYPNARVVVFDKFRGVDRFSNGNLKALGHFKNLTQFRGDVIEGDISNPADLEILEDYRFDYIFHEAAVSDTTAVEQDEVLRVNLNSFKAILELAKRKQAVVVYASSGAVYGKLPGPHRVGEEAPANVYGFSKLMMDQMAERWAKLEEFPIVGLRYFNVYGPREYWKGKTASMVLQLGLQILKEERPRLFIGSEKIKRDFVYIEDVIQANILAAIGGVSGVYNVGRGEARSFKEVEEILQQLLGTNLPVEWIQNPYIRQYQFYTEADISKTREELGYSPRYRLEEGIQEYLPEIERIYREELAQ